MAATNTECKEEQHAAGGPCHLPDVKSEESSVGKCGECGTLQLIRVISWMPLIRKTRAGGNRRGMFSLMRVLLKEFLTVLIVGWVGGISDSVVFAGVLGHHKQSCFIDRGRGCGAAENSAQCVLCHPVSSTPKNSVDS